MQTMQINKYKQTQIQLSHSTDLLKIYLTMIKKQKIVNWMKTKRCKRF